jgi:enhancing lycopene biosynthesis protein 2
VDADKKMVTTPAYMLAGCVNDAYKGIKQCVEQVLALR